MFETRVRLTRKIVEGVEPGPREQKILDADVSGFGVRIRLGGHRGYILQYRLGATTGDSLLVIGALLGHRSAKTAHRYAHLAEHPVKDAADRISAEMSRRLGDEASSAEPGSSAPSLVADAGETALAQALLGRVSQARWLPTEAAAAYLGLSAPTLHTCRWGGVGPVSRKIGKRVVYAQQDLDQWVAGRTPLRRPAA